ncbi:MAG: helix-turn-helix transcriptional regulator [Chloroflexota bacterium]
MTTRLTRHAREGRNRAEFLVRRFGTELRVARVTAGLTQSRLAELAGVSQSFVSLVERGRRAADWRLACGLALAVGHDLSLRLFPARSVSLRDSGQFVAVQRIVSNAHESWHARMEAPVAAGDSRAADLLLIGAREILHVEVERALVDFQAQLRAAQRKRSVLADSFDSPVRLVIAIPGTRRARRLVDALRPGIRAALPRTSAQTWSAIRAGAPLDGDGLLFLGGRDMTRSSYQRRDGRGSRAET